MQEWSGACARRRVIAVVLSARRSLCRSGAAALAAALAAVAACDTGDGGTGPATPGGSSGEITVVITAPALPAGGAALTLGGEVAVTGTVTATAGIKVTKVSGTLPSGANVAMTLSGKSFSGTFKTQQALPGLPEKACGKKATLNVTASDAKGENFGGASLEFTIDHCNPAVVLESPAVPKPGLPAPVFIGKVPIKGSATDARWKSGSVGWRVAGSADPPVEIIALTKSGSFEAELDRTKEASAYLEIVVAAVDLSGNATELIAPVSVLRQPSFLGNTDDNDQYPFVAADAVALDVNDDGVPDVVEGGQGGVLTRLGLSDPGSGKATGRFQAKKEVDKNKFGLVSTYQDKPITVTRLLRTDLDLQGKDAANDLVAVGTWNGAPAVIALFRVIETSETTKADGSKVSVTHVGFKALSVWPLDELPGGGEVARIDADDRDDFVLAGKSDNKGLIVLLGRSEPVCKIGANYAPCDPATVAKATEAQVFREKADTPDNKGLSQITSIAIGDFWKDDKSLDDVCVGDGSRPFVSCYRNILGNGFLAQAQDSYFIPDAPDTRLITKVEFTSQSGSDGPDLLVATSNGLIRWLRGDHQGKFKFDAGTNPNLPSRTLHGWIDIQFIQVAPVGPNNTQQVILTSLGRRVTVVPLSVSDDSHRTMCFRSWLMGGSILKTLIDDFDQDGLLDLLAVDSAPAGVPVWRGLGQGDFRAPRVHHMCAASLDKGYSIHEITKSAVVDIGDDKKPELFAVGLPSISVYAPAAASSPPDSRGGCPPSTPGGPVTPFPVWPFHLWVNADGLPAVTPRAAEFSPNSGQNVTKSGALTDCAVGTVDQFGAVSAIAFGDLDNDKAIDFAVVRSDSDYFVGVWPAPKDCGHCQPFNEDHEFNNDYGSENSPEPPDGTGQCCRNFRPDDKKKENPLKGFGSGVGISGAPLKRASLFTFLAGNNKAKPFKLDVSDTTVKPLVIGADFAQAAGRSPQAIAIGDFNGDGKRDIVVAMKADGAPADPIYFEHRLRFFKGEGNGKIVHLPFSGDFRIWKDAKGFVKSMSKVAYRVVNGGVGALLVAPYGTKGALGLFAVQPTDNKVTALMAAAGSEGPLKIALGDGIVMGDGIQACGARDFNQDSVSDLLCASSNAVGYCAGDPTGDKIAFKAKINLVETGLEAADAEIADVNQDGFPDLLLLAKAKSVVKIFLGDGKGGFAPYGGELRALTSVRRMHAADLDNDGCVDMVVSSSFGLTVLRNLACDK